jgi:APA family basic amino acid/polyamine antiporter
LTSKNTLLNYPLIMHVKPKKELNLFDSICIITGIIIGVGIYETAPTVAASTGSYLGTLAIWFLGGLIALAGALCYAELASAYPQEGGDFIYLRRAYGDWTGYLFGWSQLVIIRPGDIALMAFVFARYAGTIYSPFKNIYIIYAVSIIIILTIINILGVKESKWTQNLLTIIKIIGLLVIVIIGLLAPGRQHVNIQSSFTFGGIELALILVLFTFGGWHEIAYVAAEVKRSERNIVLSLTIGTILVTILYILINLAYIHALGFKEMSISQAVAVDTVMRLFPRIAGRLIAILICISSIAVINGLVLTGARVSYALGKKHISFRKLGKWSGYFGTPIRAIITQGILSLLIVIFAGSFINTIIYTAPVVWIFFTATGISLFVLRYKESNVFRPYKVTGYPIIPIIFCISSIFMFYSSITYALFNRPFGLIILFSVVLLGILTYLLIEIPNNNSINISHN